MSYLSITATIFGLLGVIVAIFTSIGRGDLKQQLKHFTQGVKIACLTTMAVVFYLSGGVRRKKAKLYKQQRLLKTVKELTGSQNKLISYIGYLILATFAFIAIGMIILVYSTIILYFVVDVFSWKFMVVPVFSIGYLSIFIFFFLIDKIQVLQIVYNSESKSVMIEKIQAEIDQLEDEIAQYNKKIL